MDSERLPASSICATTKWQPNASHRDCDRKTARGQSRRFRAVDVFVEALDLRGLGFEGVVAAATGRPAYHPSPMLKLYIYGYLNRVQSSRRLEREAGRNLEVMWLTGR